jgi:predicted nucleic acid-binding protein
MIVSDTGPLIVLFKIDLLFLLKDIYQEVLVPETVKIELTRKSEGIILFENNPWIKVKKATDQESIRVLSLILDSGEAEAIALALELNSIILIDERKGRNYAKKLNLRVRGTPGLLLEAKKKDKVKSVIECIYKLKRAGYYLDEELIEAILSKSGEA